MDKIKALNVLRKIYPTLVQKHNLKLQEYLDKIKTVDDGIALVMATRYLVSIDKPRKNKCELCGGSGELDEPVWDEDSKNYQPTGSRKCDCQFN